MQMTGSRRPLAHWAAHGWVAACAGLLLAGMAMAAPAARAGEAPAAQWREPLDVAGWITRMHQASLNRNYSGTFVVLSANGAMASSRIWHACDGQRQIERVEALSGTPRVVFRRAGEVRTFMPQAHIVRSEMRDTPGLFPRVPDAAGVQPAQHYAVEAKGQERVAGLDADMLAFVPRDAWRFGYRIWADRASGLVVKLQTIDGGGRVLEQAAFSELTMGVPVGLQRMARMMDDMAGYRVVVVPAQRTTGQAEGWAMEEAVAGFVPQGCYKKNGSARAAVPQPVLQCIYSDGMATLSVFIEPYSAQRHPAAAHFASMGATQVVSQKILDDTWVTAMGEVPAQTLRRFIETLRRIP